MIDCILTPIFSTFRHRRKQTDCSPSKRQEQRSGQRLIVFRNVLWCVMSSTAASLVSLFHLQKMRVHVRPSLDMDRQLNRRAKPQVVSVCVGLHVEPVYRRNRADLHETRSRQTVSGVPCDLPDNICNFSNVYFPCVFIHDTVPAVLGKQV